MKFYRLFHFPAHGYLNLHFSSFRAGILSPGWKYTRCAPHSASKSNTRRVNLGSRFLEEKGQFWGGGAPEKDIQTRFHQVIKFAAGVMTALWQNIYARTPPNSFRIRALAQLQAERIFSYTFFTLPVWCSARFAKTSSFDIFLHRVNKKNGLKLPLCAFALRVDENIITVPKLLKFGEKRRARNGASRRVFLCEPSTMAELIWINNYCSPGSREL